MADVSLSTAPTPMGLAILGLGRWGVHLLRNFLALPGAQVVAIADPRLAQLQRVQTQFDLSPGIHCHQDWREALQHPGVTAVVVVTPAASHYDIIHTALSQGHHVLAEKPLTLQAQECRVLATLAQERGCQLVVDHTYLFNPAVNQGRDWVAQLGTLRYGYAARTNLGPVRRDVDALWDLAIHDIAIFNHWLQAGPDWVSAQGQTWLQPDPVEPGFPQGLADVVWLRLHYPQGVTVAIEASWANPDKQRRLGLVGDRGTLVFSESPTPALTYYPGSLHQDGDGFWQPTVSPPEMIPLLPGEPLRLMCEHFLATLQSPTPSPLSGPTVATTLVAILEALSQSLRQNGQPVPVA